MSQGRASGDKRRTTLKEVAKEVGVSICTASVVLNGSSSGSRISPTTRQAVIRAAHDLGYRSSQDVAVPVSTQRSRMIGVIPAATDTNILLGPHLQLVLNGIVNEAESNHYDLSLITRCDQSHPIDLLEALLAGKMEGVVVVAPRADSRLLPLLKERSLPMVVIDGDPAQCDNNFVIHNYQAVKIAIAHLVQLGHSRIGYIAGPQDHFAARARKDAFFEVMAGFGLTVNFEWVQVGEFTLQAGIEGARRILRAQTPPTAIFCANDEIAFGAMDTLQELGLKVPGDISIVGFDNVPLAQHSHPPLTTVRHPVDAISAAAARALFRYIEDGARIESLTFPGELIVRRSTAPPPGEPTS